MRIPQDSVAVFLLLLYQVIQLQEYIFIFWCENNFYYVVISVVC